MLQLFTASDGATIAYRDEGAGVPLVLLHGLMAHGGFFREQQALAADFRLITIDLRGHGESHGAPAPTVERIAADVAGLAEALDLEGAIGIGWSLGATVLWHVLSGPAAARFAGAVVIDMTARVRNDSRWDLGLSPEACDARSLAIRDDYESFAFSAGQAIFAQPVAAGRRQLATWVSEEFARNDAGAMAAVWESLVVQDVRALLASIRHPTLIVHGAHSSLYGDGTADHLVAALPQARAVRFERSGHAPHLEEPDLFNDTLKEFAGRLSRARAAQTTE
ncbi:MAG: alpha/beta hydrolase [Alphaproteobacteria bacterium]|nr:MAG: alpha/beta hydrolase [Alphaproteobacteria bacterium]